GVLNCHMGILPRYKGMDVVEWPLLLNDKDNVGVTTHFMDKGVDTGRIIAKEYIKPRAGETIAQLRQRFEPVMVKNLVQSTMDILNNMAEAVEQEDRGHQYFIMHPRLAEIAAENLKKS
ncbi:MAG TPA: formyltransferase family protein, partial [Flavipsychrobacter sp.]|nr:formyltransferase family protein [Flavipsychrobacter sp.]